MVLVRNLLFKSLYFLGIGHLLLETNRKKSRIPILVFHKVNPEKDEVWPGLDPALFEKMIVLLKKHYTILPLNRLYSKNREELKNACFITFDDGYTDYLEFAYPILKKHNVHSTIFILPFDMSNQGHIWTSSIMHFVKKYAFAEIDKFFKAHGRVIDCSPSLDRFKLNLLITKNLCQLTQSERGPIIQALQNKFKTDEGILEKELLNMDDMKELDTRWVDFASHSLTHPSFKLETNEAFIEHELKDSKEIIESELNVKINMFAFPFNKYNDLALKTVKKYYNLCFTRRGDFVDLNRLSVDKEYLFDLPRFNVHHATPEEVFLLANGFHKIIGR